SALPQAYDGDPGPCPRVFARDRSSQARPAAGHEHNETLVRVGSEGGAVVLGPARPRWHGRVRASGAVVVRLERPFLDPMPAGAYPLPVSSRLDELARTT